MKWSFRFLFLFIHPNHIIWRCHWRVDSLKTTKSFASASRTLCFCLTETFTFWLWLRPYLTTVFKVYNIYQYYVILINRNKVQKLTLFYYLFHILVELWLLITSVFFSAIKSRQTKRTNIKASKQADKASANIS